MNAASHTRSPLRFLEAKRPSLIVALGLALVLLVGTVDYLTGTHVFFLVFYLLPIFIVSWYAPRPMGLVLAVVAAAVWLLGQVWWPVPSPAVNDTTAAFYWNIVVKMGFLVLFAILLGLLKEAYDKEKTHARTDELSCYLRTTDIVGRLGGDEFVVLMPETPASEAEKVLEKLRRHLLQTAEDKDVDVTFSIGAVAFLQAPDAVDELIRSADKTMYSVKQEGKDRVQLGSV